MSSANIFQKICKCKYDNSIYTEQNFHCTKHESIHMYRLRGYIQICTISSALERELTWIQKTPGQSSERQQGNCIYTVRE